MQFKNGYLGGMVVLLAVVGTILGSWVLSLDVTEQEVTAYSFVTELTGQFETEQAPSYIEYNPSTNYTGYYTNASTKYFDGVDYTESSQRNQYRLNLEPLSQTADASIDLSSLTSDTDSVYLFYWATAGSVYEKKIDHITLADLITEEGWTDYDEIILVSDFTDWTGGFVTFYVETMLDSPLTVSSGSALSLKNPTLTGDLTVRTGTTVSAESVQDPVLACKYDAETGYAELYYSDDFTETALGVFDPTDVSIAWETGASDTLGYTVIMSGVDYPDAKYMDIRQGVNVS